MKTTRRNEFAEQGHLQAAINYFSQTFWDEGTPRRMIDYLMMKYAYIKDLATI